MKILIDINHPAHVHLLKNLIFELKKGNNTVILTVKEVPAAIRLLENLNLDFISLGNKVDSIKGKFVKQLQFDLELYKIVKKYGIDYGIGSSITLSHVSRLTKMKSFILDDDDSAVQPLFAKFAFPFADFILSPDCLSFERTGRKNVNYSGYHELAYLHPKRFEPNPQILKEVGIKDNEKFFILRFNAFKAHHDVGAQGLSLADKRKLIGLLSQHGKIFITTEDKINPEFEQYQLNLSVEKIHSLIYYATMLIGDSQTMTSEAAVLGTPSIRSNSFVGRIAYLEEQEHKYGLTFGFLPNQTENMLQKINKLLNIPNLKQEWQIRRQKMLSEKIDVTAFLLWFVENFPESFPLMKENPERQYSFV